MSNVSKEELALEDGTVVNISIVGCESSILNICPCACIDGGDKPGGGDGDGGDKPGDGDGGDKPGDGDGDGGDKPGGGDDSKEGTIGLTLLGQTGFDAFNDFVRTDDGGYLAFGRSDKTYGVPMVAQFTPRMAFTGLTSYRGLREKTSIVNVTSVPNLPGHILGINDEYAVAGTTSKYHDLILMHIDPVTRKIINSKTHKIDKGSTYASVLKGVPEKFSGSGSFAAAGSVYDARKNHAFLASFDKQMNMLDMHTMTFGGGSLNYEDVHISSSKYLAVGYVIGANTAGLSGGLLVEYNDILEPGKKIAYGYDKNMGFKFIRKLKEGFLVAGYLVDKVTAKTHVLLLYLDDQYQITRKAVVGGTGSESLHSLDIDSEGNILLCGSSTGVGAGSNDIFVIRLDKTFEVTKQLVFGSTGDENQRGKALFNADGSVTVCGATPGAGAGNYDAFMVTFSGDWKELTGSIAKYPALKINGKPGFQVLMTDFDLTINDKTTITPTGSKLVPVNSVITSDDTVSLIVDSNALTTA